MAAIGGQLVEEGHSGPAPSTVEKPPVAAPSGHGVDHGEDGCDADPPGDEEIVLGLDEREVVARPDELDRRPRPELVMNVHRATAAARFPLYRDPPPTRLGRVAAQRELGNEAGRQDQVEMGVGWDGQAPFLAVS